MEEQIDNSIEKQKQQRDEKLKNLWTKPIIFIPIILLLIMLGVFIRIQPILDHNGSPGLIDITTGTWTLGPDLDPFLFLRYAQELDSTGHIDSIDEMRSAPLGAITSDDTVLLPYLIYYTKIVINLSLNLIDSTGFSQYRSIDFAAVIFPVIFFVFTIIAFFLFVYSVFSGKKQEHSNMKKMLAGVIASISTLFMIVIPSFLGRTVAGIPEKESAGFFFLFISLYFFVLTFKSEKVYRAILFGLLTGLSTALMALVWGGMIYVYVTISVTCLIGLVLNKLDTVHKIGYIAWFISSLTIIQMFTTKFGLLNFLTSLGTGLSTVAFVIIIVSLIVDKLKQYQLEKYIGLPWLKERTKLPENLIIIVLAMFIMMLAAILAFGPHFIVEKIGDINRVMFNPLSNGRWSTTVAENAQPYFVQWLGTLGTYMFLIFVAGSAVFFWSFLGSKFETKEKMQLLGLYLFFFSGIVFSRYAPHPSLFDGENFISKAFYMVSALCFISGLIYFYIKGEKTGRKMFENVDISGVLLFVLFVLALFTARSAIRLIMVFAIIAPVFISYLITKVGHIAIFEEKEKRLGFTLVCIALILVASTSGYSFYSATKSQAYQYVPYYYTYQWQEGMSWVRDNTPTDAVFAHWWDYGYWVQTMGKRATMTDGGNSIVYWNYLTGRYVLTGDNQKESLEVLYPHNVTHLLIDSTDLGKYGAFSQIGSNKTFDRLSYGPITMLSDNSQIVETRDGYTKIYQGGAYIDEDISYNKTYLFTGNSAILGIKIPVRNETFTQPIGVYYLSGRNIELPLRYLYMNGTMIDFGTGVEAAAYPIQNINVAPNNQLSIDQTGALIYLSPRILRGYLGQVYILNDPFNNFPNFKLTHTQPDYILEMIKQQTGAELGDFVVYQGIKGPIKIWDITYPSDIEYKAEYLNKAFPAEVDWQF